MRSSRGFTLIELVAIILILGVLAVSATTRLTSSALQELSAAKDLTTNALFVAQQKAMTQLSSVQVTTSAGAIDLKVGGTSVRTSGTSYPLSLPANVTISSSTIDYDRLGHTSAINLTLSKSGKSVVVYVSGTGYAY